MRSQIHSVAYLHFSLPADITFPSLRHGEPDDRSEDNELRRKSGFVESRACELLIRLLALVETGTCNSGSD